jgi:hypothetical protein
VLGDGDILHFEHGARHFAPSEPHSSATVAYFRRAVIDPQGLFNSTSFCGVKHSHHNHSS